MRGFSLAALAAQMLSALLWLPQDDEWMKKCAAENCPYMPQYPWNPDLPPDPHPFLHLSVAFCVIVAVVTVLTYLTATIHRERTLTLTEEESRDISEGVSDALASIGELRGAELRARCKVIVVGLLIALDVSLQNVREYYIDHEPKDKAVLECIRAIMSTGTRLRLRVARTEAMLTFPALLSWASKRTIEAAREYGALVKLIKCCNSKLHRSASTMPTFEIKLPEA